MFIAPCLCPAFPEEAGWTPLFNGKDLTGWEGVKGPKDRWQVKDGILRCTGVREDKDEWLSTTEEFANFELSLEFNISEGGNSGVFLRASHTAEKIPAYSALEVQILDDDTKKFGQLKPTQLTGSLYDVVAATPRVSKSAGEWQSLDILCDGNHLRVTLNGTVVVDTQLDQHPESDEKHPGLKRTSGYIGFQNYGIPVEFRNIRIRRLP